MKQIYLTISVCCLLQLTFAQTKFPVFPKENFLKNKSFTYQKPLKNKIQSKANFRVAATCGPDTINYINVKNSFKEDAGLNIFPIINRDGYSIIAGQYYSSPQPITILGFYFYACQYDISATPTPSNLTCSVYAAGADSTINRRLGAIEAAKASVSVQVDTSGLRGSATAAKRFARFTTPVTLAGSFIISIANPSAVTPVYVFTNNYDDSTDYYPRVGKPRIPDGLGEELMIVAGRFTSSAITSEKATNAYNGLDGDLIIAPIVNYDIDANFSVDKTIAAAGQAITFTNLSSPILYDGVYNIVPYIYDQDSLSFAWRFGDGPPNIDKIDYIAKKTFTRSYAKPGVYNVSLTDSIYGYNQSCGATSKVVQITITEPQGVSRAYENSNFQVFPNPAENILYITTKNMAGVNYTASLTDMAGKEVLSENINIGNEGSIDLTGITGGYYLLKLTDANQTVVKQVLIK